MSEITETRMHHLICAFCDNPKCVRNTEKCEFEQWKRKHTESLDFGRVLEDVMKNYD